MKPLEGDIIEATKIKDKRVKYSKEMCESLIEMCKEGKSEAHFRVKHVISRTAFHNWKKKYKEFEEACSIAKDALVAFWEHKAALATFKEIDVDSKLMLRMLDHHSDSENKSTDQRQPNVINVNIDNTPKKELTDEERRRAIEELQQKLLEDN